MWMKVLNHDDVCVSACVSVCVRVWMKVSRHKKRSILTPAETGVFLRRSLCVPINKEHREIDRITDRLTVRQPDKQPDKQSDVPNRAANT